MIITLYGPDSYRRGQKLKEIVGRFLEKKSRISYEEVDGDDEDALSRARDFMGTPSLFGDPKLLVMQRVLAHESQALLKKLLKDAAPNSSATIIISDDAKQLRKELSFLKEKPNLVQEFKALERAQFISFIGEEAGRLGLGLDGEAIERLTAAFIPDTWGVATELSKLYFLSLSKEYHITPSLLTSLGVSAQDDFFFYISGWFRRSSHERLRSLEELFSAKHNPAKIFNIMAYLDPRELRRFADYDVEVKSGRLEYEEALLELAL